MVFGKVRSRHGFRLFVPNQSLQQAIALPFAAETIPSSSSHFGPAVCSLRFMTLVPPKMHPSQIYLAAYLRSLTRQ